MKSVWTSEASEQNMSIRSGGEAWMNRCKRERLGRCLDGIESDKDEVVNGTDDGLVISIKGVSQLKRMRHFRVSERPDAVDLSRLLNSPPYFCGITFKWNHK